MDVLIGNKVGELIYENFGGEGKLFLSNDFTDMMDHTQMDLLNDWIYELQEYKKSIEQARAENGQIPFDAFPPYPVEDKNKGLKVVKDDKDAD
jgi:hypothetical protein